MSEPRIETARLLLRRFGPSDLDGFAALLGDPAVTRYLPIARPHTREETEKTLNRIFERDRAGLITWALTWRESRALIGYCGLMPLAETLEVEIFYGLAPVHWGCGLVTEAARACLRHGFERLCLPRIAAITHRDNLASQMVLEKLGFGYQRDANYYGMAVKYFSLESSEFRAGAHEYRFTES